VIGASKIARDISDRVQGTSRSRRLERGRRVVRRRDHHQEPRQHHHLLEPAAERMFGYTEEEAIGKSIRMIIPAELQDEEDHVLSRSAAGEKWTTTRPSACARTASAAHFADGLADPRRSAARSSAPRRSPATSPSARAEAAAHEHARQREKLAEVGALVASTLDRDRSRSRSPTARPS
jgi:hypothetical protein